MYFTEKCLHFFFNALGKDRGPPRHFKWRVPESGSPWMALSPDLVQSAACLQHAALEAESHRGSGVREAQGVTDAVSPEVELERGVVTRPELLTASLLSSSIALHSRLLHTDWTRSSPGWNLLQLVYALWKGIISCIGHFLLL